ncbi:MAG: hypothetical protein AAF352_09160 [Pseudomonadota bacterium]
MTHALAISLSYIAAGLLLGGLSGWLLIRRRSLMRLGQQMENVAAKEDESTNA